MGAAAPPILPLMAVQDRIDVPEQVVVRAFGAAAIIVTVQLAAAGVFLDIPLLFLAAVAPFVTGIVAFVAYRWLRAPAALVVAVSSVAIAIDVGMTADAQYHLLGLGAIIVLGLIAVMLSAQRWVAYMVGFACLIVVSNSYWNRAADLTEPIANGLSMSIIFLIGASLAAWVRSTKLKTDERYRTLVQRAPTSIWEEDFTAVGRWIDGLRSEGVTDLRGFLTPEMIRDASALIEVREVNQACVDLLEAGDAGQLVGSLRPDSVSDDTLESLAAQLGAVWNREDHLTTEVRGVTLRGNPIEGILHWSAPRINGRIDLANVVVSVTDVRPLKETQRRLADLVDSKDRFVASVSHELRTPLTTVVGFSAELRDHFDDFTPSELREMLDLIATQAADVGYIVEDLLVVARADLGTIALHREELDMRAIIHEVVSANPPDVLDVPNLELTTRADSIRARQILRNLITNARRYGGDEVTLSAGGGNETIWVEVIDNGEGVRADDAARIFLPYETAHQRLGVTGSVGLGLAVAKRLAQLMDGDLRYERRGGLTVFRLDLPKAPNGEKVAATA
jgi:signal transduction histidine kinase